MILKAISGIQVNSVLPCFHSHTVWVSQMLPPSLIYRLSSPSPPKTFPACRRSSASASQRLPRAYAPPPRRLHHASRFPLRPFPHDSCSAPRVHLSPAQSRGRQPRPPVLRPACRRRELGQGLQKDAQQASARRWVCPSWESRCCRCRRAPRTRGRRLDRRQGLRGLCRRRCRRCCLW